MEDLVIRNDSQCVFDLFHYVFETINTLTRYVNQ